LAKGLGRDAALAGAERPLRSPTSLPELEPELKQGPDDAACAVTLQIDRDEVAAVRIASDEQRTRDPHRSPCLDPLERADQAPLEAGVRAESIHEELRGLHEIGGVRSGCPQAVEQTRGGRV
jgi:hypothetical protein